MPACALIFVKVFSEYLPGWIYHDQDICGFSTPPTYNFHPQNPPEIDAVPLGHLIAEFPRIMLAFLMNMKRKFMFGVAFALFVPTATAHNGGT